MSQFLQEMPKVELHLHLEGAIPPSALWSLMEKYGGDPAVPDMAALHQRFTYTDFPAFITTWIWKNGFLREYEDFEYIAQAVADDLVRQNINYAEVFYSPGDFVSQGLEPCRLTESIRRGLNKNKQIIIALIADLIRDFGPEKGARWLEEIAQVKGEGVIGIGLGGSENEFPPEPYARVYEHARSLGFRTSVHAGEAAGPQSVRDAIIFLKPDRIGHGLTACQDPGLMALLKARRIPLELCPISNLRTGGIRHITEHPVREYFDWGIPISINTDDPAMFNTSLVEEFRVLMQSFHFSREEIRQVCQMTIDAAWCDTDLRTDLTNQLTGYFHTVS